ncbi:MAG: hypothetical protein ACKVP4_05270 [Hyphomicrobium sp.]
MMRSKFPSLADLIAATPGAQSRGQALASVKTRRAQLLSSAAPLPPTDFGAPEPMPLLDAPDEYAKEFFQRLMTKDMPRKGSKPRLVIDNKDDDPEPPKAA